MSPTRSIIWPTLLSKETKKLPLLKEIIRHWNKVKIPINPHKMWQLQQIQERQILRINRLPMHLSRLLLYCLKMLFRHHRIVIILCSQQSKTTLPQLWQQSPKTKWQMLNSWQIVLLRLWKQTKHKCHYQLQLSLRRNKWWQINSIDNSLILCQSKKQWQIVPSLPSNRLPQRPQLLHQLLPLLL